MIDFCKKYLEEWKFSPFAISRLWTKQIRATASKTIPPRQVHWVDSETLKIESATISISEYLQYLHDELHSLLEFLRKTLMFDIPVEDFHNMCNPTTLPKATGHSSPGDNPLFNETSYYKTNASAFFLNQDALKFVTHMVQGEHLGLSKMTKPLDILVPQPKNRQIEWDNNGCHDWLSKVHVAWEKAYCLYHTTSGLPARVTEEVILRITQSHLGPSNLFIFNGKVQTRSDYNKTSTTSGLNKYITRVLHPHLAQIFFILLRCIRPIELQVLKGTNIADDTTEFVYTTMLFASWGKMWKSREASEAFAIWFSKGLSLDGGIALYRQFATALQRKWLSEMDDIERSKYDQATECTESQFEAVSEWWHTNLKLGQHL